MIALADFMKSPKSIKILDFQQFSTICWLWLHPVISTIPNRLDSVEEHTKFGSNIFKRLWNERFREKQASWSILDGHARHDRTSRFHEISKIHKNPPNPSKPLDILRYPMVHYACVGPCGGSENHEKHVFSYHQSWFMSEITRNQLRKVYRTFWSGVGHSGGALVLYIGFAKIRTTSIVFRPH